MKAKDLVLNIAVNMGRVSRWAMEGKRARIILFLDETQNYLEQLEQAKVSTKFYPTLESFKVKFSKLKNNIELNDAWAEDALTWANILQHRAKLT